MADLRVGPGGGGKKPFPLNGHFPPLIRAPRLSDGKSRRFFPSTFPPLIPAPDFQMANPAPGGYRMLIIIHWKFLNLSHLRGYYVSHLRGYYVNQSMSKYIVYRMLKTKTFFAETFNSFNK